MNSLLLLLVTGLGLAIGSFFNALVWRFRRSEKITDRRSVCPHCRHALGPRDLIPIASYLMLAGRCRYCRKPISIEYPLVELATAIVLLLPLAVWGASGSFVIVACFALFLELLFLLDAHYSILPDSVTLPGIAIGVAVGLVLGRDFSTIVIGGILGAGFFTLQYLVSRGRWIGSGDIRLGAMMGFALGWQLVLIAFAIAYISGAIAALVLIAARRKRLQSQMPFGTFLAAATFVALLAGQQLVHLALFLSI